MVVFEHSCLELLPGREGDILFRNRFTGFLTALSAILGTSMCLAQNASTLPSASSTAPLLSVSAQEAVTLQPVAIQLRYPFRAEGREAEETIAAIREHRKTVEKLLGQLGRTDGEYRWTMPILSNTVPFVDNPDSARQWMRRQAAQMQVNNPQMRGRLREMLLQEEEELDGDAEPLPFIHAATNRLVAQWPITEETLDGSIEFGAKLRRLAQSKEFRGTKLRVQLSEEELEQIMPLMGASAYVSSSIPASNTESQVLYVGVMTEGQEAAALKKCFEKAKGQALRLAQAAGKELGEVRMISSTIQSIAANNTNSGPTYVNGVLVGTPYAVQDAQEKTERRILQSNPNDLVLSVNVQVGFEIR